MTTREQDKILNKLYVRDERRNLAAGSNRPLLYNVAPRPAFAAAITGTPWHAGEVKPDPATRRKRVQIAAPVRDGGKAIGVIHPAIMAE